MTTTFQRLFCYMETHFEPYMSHWALNWPQKCPNMVSFLNHLASILSERGLCAEPSILCISLSCWTILLSLILEQKRWMVEIYQCRKVIKSFSEKHQVHDHYPVCFWPVDTMPGGQSLLHFFMWSWMVEAFIESIILQFILWDPNNYGLNLES